MNDTATHTQDQPPETGPTSLTFGARPGARQKQTSGLGIGEMNLQPVTLAHRPFKRSQ